MCLPKILFPVFKFAFIFSLPLSFSHSTAAMNFSCFPSKEIRLLCFHRSSSFSVIQVSVNIKNNVEKDTTLLLFFSVKVRAAMRFPSK